MASGTRGRPRRVQGRVSEPAGSTPSRSPSPFLGDPDELAGAQAPPPGPPNVPVAAIAGPGAQPRVYTNDNVQDIIRAVMEARPVAAKGPCQRPLKARFPDVYRGDNHMACYNFCQQCEDHFATAGAKGPNRIPFVSAILSCISSSPKSSL